MTSPYGTVVFDFGGVFTGSPFLTLSRAVAERGVDAEAGLYEVFGDYARDTDHPWHRLERGEISFMDARGEIMESSSATLGVQLDLIELFAAFTSDANARPDMVELARRIGASGRTVGLLTNNLAEFNDGWRSLLPVDELFSQVVDSSREGMRKPDPAIYHLTQERLGVEDPASILFLDDAEGNIVAARDVGWHTVQVEDDYQLAITQVESLLDL
ncbi:MAG: HAD family hydrolase [Acidimicrobiales bacterium]